MNCALRACRMRASDVMTKPVPQPTSRQVGDCTCTEGEPPQRRVTEAMVAPSPHALVSAALRQHAERPPRQTSPGQCSLQSCADGTASVAQATHFGWLIHVGVEARQPDVRLGSRRRWRGKGGHRRRRSASRLASTRRRHISKPPPAHASTHTASTLLEMDPGGRRKPFSEAGLPQHRPAPRGSTCTARRVVEQPWLRRRPLRCCGSYRAGRTTRRVWTATPRTRSGRRCRTASSCASSAAACTAAWACT